MTQINSYKKEAFNLLIKIGQNSPLESFQKLIKK